MIQRYSYPVETRLDPLQTDSELRLIAPEEDWKSLLKNSVTSTAALLEALDLAEHPLADSSAEALFPLRVPQPYLNKIRKGDPQDPLLLQVLPLSSEHKQVDGFSTDPLNEQQYSPVPGLIHKYRSRVLFVMTQACAVHCRYCFRRSFPYASHKSTEEQWAAPLDYVAKHPQINEVILSGGDPLMLGNKQLRALFGKLESIPHIKRVRIHTRMLTTLPHRADEGFLSLIRETRLRCIVVLHCNHERELDALSEAVCKQLSYAGALLLNQSVLLKSVNDDPETLAALSERLSECGIQPYYLFTLDKIQGAAHFDVPVARVKEIYRDLLAQLPGFLVPKLVAEIPGKKSKTPLDIENL